MRFARAASLATLAALAAACDTSRAIVEKSAEASDCARCHGNPPPPYVTTTGSNHPANTDCHLCHPGTVEDDNVTIVPGGLHMNGTVDVAGAPHAMPYVADHAPAALADIGSCTSCHGTDYGGGGSGVSCNACHADTATYPALAPGFPDWKTNCTFCHGTRTASVATATAAAAPPVAVDRSTAPAKVGAHQAHLVAGTFAGALPCATCHAVPSGAQALAHFSGGPAAIAFDALASQGVTTPAYAGAGGGCTVYCHGSGSSWPTGSVAANRTPAWSSTGLACNACHASRPRTGNATGAGSHFAGQHNGAPCASCHDGYVQDTTVNAAIHVDGKRTVRFPARTPAQATSPVITAENPGWSNCTLCHDAGPNGNANAPAF